MTENRKEYQDHYHNEHNILVAMNVAFIERLPKQALKVTIICPYCHTKRLIGKALQGIGLLQQPCEGCSQKSIEKGRNYAERNARKKAKKQA